MTYKIIIAFLPYRVNEDFQLHKFSKLSIAPVFTFLSRSSRKDLVICEFNRRDQVRIKNTGKAIHSL